MQDWAFLLILLALIIGLFVGFFYIALKYLEKKIETLPTHIGNSIKGAKGTLGRLQKEMDKLARMDMGKFIEENPVVVDIFPTLIEKAVQKDAQPQMISSIVQLVAPAVIGLITNNSNAPDALKAIAGSGGATILSGIMKALGAFRAKAKEDYNPNQPKDSKSEKAKKVHTAPKVESI